jgi:purine-nucleoside phosphorylase
MSAPLIPTHDIVAHVAEAVAVIRAQAPWIPQVAFTLGSGLGALADIPAPQVALATASLPHWPRSTVSGHAGRLVVGIWEGVSVAILAGRSHRYEGYSLDQVTFGVRVMRALGAGTMIFTNAVGSTDPDLDPGELMLAVDHVNAIGKRGLFTTGELAERRAGRKVAHLHDPELGAALEQAAIDAGVTLRRGVLMGGLGPAYETVAEIRMAQKMGAYAVCMSTVHEVTLAAHLGCKAASLSCVTNRASGLSDSPLSHREVIEVADRVAVKLRAVLSSYLGRRASGVGQP